MEDKEDFSEEYTFTMKAEYGDSYRDVYFKFKTESLLDVLENMKNFLSSIGFSYVESLAATSANKAWVANDRDTYTIDKEDLEKSK